MSSPDTPSSTPGDDASRTQPFPAGPGEATPGPGPGTPGYGTPGEHLPPPTPPGPPGPGYGTPGDPGYGIPGEAAYGTPAPPPEYGGYGQVQNPYGQQGQQQGQYGGNPYGSPQYGAYGTPGYGAPAQGAPGYGAPYGAGPGAPYGVDPGGRPYSEKSKIVAGVLNILLPFGIGRFYTGHTGKAVAQLLVAVLTCGLGSIWSLVDGVLILVGDSTDAHGRPLRS